MGYNSNMTELIIPNNNANIELLFSMILRAYNKALLRYAFNKWRNN